MMQVHHADAVFLAYGDKSHGVRNCPEQWDYESRWSGSTHYRWNYSSNIVFSSRQVER